jgi:hypothetical protein
MTSGGLKNLAKSSVDGGNELVQTMIQDEMEKYKKEARDRKKEYEKKIAEKNTRINDLLTDLENMKTDLQSQESKNERLVQEKELLL